jgi:carboxyl-terminal processing protease
MNLRNLPRRPIAIGLMALFAATALGGESAAAPPDEATTEADIARITTNLLERSQFAHRPLDAALAAVFLDRYFDALDPARSVFLQSDVDELTAYRATLPTDLRRDGDTRAASAIFARYLERLKQQVAYVDETLKTATFDFTGHDVYSFDRAHAARPVDLAAARALWRQRLRAEYLQLELSGEKPAQIESTLARRYAGELESTKSLTPSDVLDIYLDTLAHVYDPHSDYLGHEQLETFAIGMNLSLVGIGATLESTNGYCVIRDLVPGGPAARSGALKPGDRIVSVAQPGKPPVDVVGMALSRTVELIRGAKGSAVTLKILPAGATDGAVPKTVAIVRDEVKLADQEASARIIDLPTGKGATRRIGVIDLPSFYADMGLGDGAVHRSATADVAALLAKLQAEHVTGIVLDLRRNGGGSLGEAISLTGLFIRKGPVVQTRDRAGDIDVGADTDPSVAYDGPLVLLTSRFSASATEILAGALQDYGRALVVGDSTTFGKGTVQSVIPLERVMDHIGVAHAFDPGALKVTISKFYRPSGASTQLRGVSADIVLPSTSDVSGVAESALEGPLPWDTVPPAPFERLDRVAPYVAELRDRSVARRALEKDFSYLAGDIARVRDSVTTKSVSLNEAERRKQLAEDEARHEAREREDRLLRASRPTTYAITVENASSPGLPAPIAAAPEVAKARHADDLQTPDAIVAGETRSSEEDITLDEAERILADFIDLSAKSPTRGTPSQGT